MAIALDRSLCCDLNETSTREWLITNGVGGYAAGTVSGMLTRMEHGLLVSSPLAGRDTSSSYDKDLATPQLLLAKMDEEVVFDRRTYYLGTNEYRDRTLNPSGFVHLETFRLEEGFPIFTYRIGGIDGIILEKRIWMSQGQNTTYIQYRVLRTETAHETPYHTNHADASFFSTHVVSGNGYSFKYSEAAQRELTLTLLPFSAYRPFNQPQHGNNDWLFQVHQLSSEQEPNQLPKGTAGCTIQAWEGAHPYHILAVGHAQCQVSFIPTNVWYWNVLRRHDLAAGREAVDDLYLPGVIRAKLWPAEDCALTIVVTTEELSAQTFNLNQLKRSYARAVESQRDLLQPQRYFGEGGETTQSLHILPLLAASDPHSSGEEYLRLLLQAANRLIIERSLPRNEGKNMLPILYMGQEKVPVVLADYYGMQSSTRDTLIALPGLLLATGRYSEAGRILHWLARSFKQGLLPDHLPLSGQTAEANDYANVDVTLWYLYALDNYLRITHDYELLREVYPRLVDSIDWYISGTDNGIHCDPNDGLLQAKAHSKALTWMNATSQKHPVTPRGGKPVEVNALWYHALSLMHEWSQSQYSNGQSNHAPSYYEERSKRCRLSFQRKFWNANAGYLYDVVDGPHGNDAALRPNQLLAISLRYPVLDIEYQRPVFEQVTEHLLTPFGLRTLAPEETAYRGDLPEQQKEQQQALHQGSVWPWLLGPYIEAMLNMQALDARTPYVRGADSNLPQEYLWRKSIQLLEPFRKQLETGMLGMVGSVFSGAEPHVPGYNAASALTIGEILHIYHRLTQQRVQRPVELMTVKSQR
ncbi:MAG TPA: amylo-alpha-1,6-glucosidase [Ktedonobacteraceae bacterium]|nr:amylo-alpha-1,6-glucosidase [Ktedonobacteraceae bacterium]